MKNRIVNGLTILGGAGLVFAFGDLLIPQENLLFEATQKPQEYAHLVTSSQYQLWALRGFLGVWMEMFGTLALYFWLAQTKVERLAFWGLVLSLTHQMMGMGVFALAYFFFPAIGHLVLAGNIEAVNYVAIEGNLGIFMVFSLLVTLVGLAVMAVAIWRSQVLPKWSGWLVFIGFALLPLPGVALQFGANLLWGVAYFWMAYDVYQQKSKFDTSKLVLG